MCRCAHAHSNAPPTFSLFLTVSKGPHVSLQTKVREFNISDLDLIMDELDALNLQAVMMGQDHEKQLERLVSIFLNLMFVLVLTDM